MKGSVHGYESTWGIVGFQFDDARRQTIRIEHNELAGEYFDQAKRAIIEVHQVPRIRQLAGALAGVPEFTDHLAVW
jgi:hypothetical protein